MMRESDVVEETTTYVWIIRAMTSVFNALDASTARAIGGSRASRRASFIMRHRSRPSRGWAPRGQRRDFYAARGGCQIAMDGEEDVWKRRGRVMYVERERLTRVICRVYSRNRP